MENISKNLSTEIFRRFYMEEEIIEELMKECNVSDEIIIKIFINICKYYKQDIYILLDKFKDKI